MEQLLGAHTFLTGGISSSITNAEKLGFTAIQIFTKNNNRWNAKSFTEDEINEFRDKFLKSSVKYVVSHDSYLINLCSPKEDIYQKSLIAFEDELARCEVLGIPHLNFHPGSHLGKGENYGLQKIAESLNLIHQKTKGFKVKSMMETTAGQGTNLGYTFEQLKKIIDLIEEKTRIAICIDTAHIFAAGYNIKDEKEYLKVINDFNDIIGLEMLHCFHFNDSKKELGSRVDRHEHIGKGFIGLEGFHNILNDERLKHIPKILETPKGKSQSEDLENLQVLRNLIC